MNRRTVHAVSCVALLLLLAAFAPGAARAADRVGARVYYWFPDLSGTVAVNGNGIPGTPLDVVGTLGVKDEDFVSGEAFARLWRFVFRLGYTPISYDGDAVLNQTIVFNGQTFNVSERVVSKLDMDMIDGEVEFELLRPDFVAFSLNLGVLARVKYLDGFAELSSASVGTERHDFSLPFPMVGATAGVGVLKNFVRADVRLAGLGYSGDSMLEAEAYVSVIPFPFLRIQGGYRYLSIDVEEDEGLADLEIKGPYLGLQLSF